VTDLRTIEAQSDVRRRMARAVATALAVATMGLAGVTGALAQQSDSVYGGGTGVSPVDTGAGTLAPTDTSVSLPVPADTGTMVENNLPVPGVTNVNLGAELPAPTIPNTTIRQAPLSPTDLTAIFGPNFPFPPENNPERTVAGKINVGGSSGGTITMGGAEGGITMGPASGGGMSGTGGGYGG
jgi:hypothetical protein